MIRFNEVTWYSKLGAAILIFLVLPVLSFYIGMRYDEVKNLSYVPPIISISRGQGSTNKKIVPPPVQTNDWIVHKNTTYKYELKYPSKAKIKENKGTAFSIDLVDALDIAKYVPKADGSNFTEGLGFTIYSSVAEKGLTLETWLNQQNSIKQAPEPASIETTTLGEERALLVKFNRSLQVSNEPYDGMIIYSIHNGMKYEIIGVYVPEELKTDPKYNSGIYYEPVFKAILDSFKFTS